jgi:hypothetical protein
MVPASRYQSNAIAISGNATDVSVYSIMTVTATLALPR